MANKDYIYQMIGTEKVLPSGRTLLQPTWLSFYPDAKIGVLGHNGAGKSTLMKIMAGLDTEFNGEAWAADGIKVGYLAQEPELDDLLPIDGNGQWHLQLTPLNEGVDPPDSPDWYGYGLI